MSVIWSGVTEEGAVVPVQVTAEGKVVAVGDGPVGDYLPITGGELTGDLEVDGSITAAGNVALNTGNAASGTQLSINKAGGGLGAYFYNDNTSTQLYLNKVDGIASINLIGSDGSITAAGNLRSDRLDSETSVYSQKPNSSAYSFQAKDSKGDVYFGVRSTSPGSGQLYLGGTFLPDAPKIELNGDDGSITAAGSATFAGDVVIGSRGTTWLIRESNGVAMLIEQTLRGQAEPRMEKVRDLPNELDLIETALNEVMEKLRMTPPAGWPVWDGSDNA